MSTNNWTLNYLVNWWRRYLILVNSSQILWFFSCLETLRLLLLYCFVIGRLYIAFVLNAFASILSLFASLAYIKVRLFTQLGFLVFVIATIQCYIVAFSFTWIGLIIRFWYADLSFWFIFLLFLLSFATALILFVVFIVVPFRQFLSFAF